MKALQQTITKGLHNLISTRPPRTNRLLMLFLVCVTSITGFVMFQASKMGLEQDLRKHHIQATLFHADTLGKQIVSFIADRVKFAESQTRLPIIQQSIMQPESGRLILADWFREPGIFGHEYPQVLVDINGMVIAERYLPAPLYRNIDAYRPLLTGEQSDTVSLVTHIDADDSGKQHFIEIAVPVEFGNYPEGLLISWIPLAALADALNLESLTGLALRIDTPAGDSVEWGAGTAERWTPIPSPKGLNAFYKADMRAFDKSIADARARLALSTLTIALLAAILATVLGRWFFVKPLERLQTFAEKLSHGANAQISPEKRLTVEIQALSDTIVDMGQRIRRREQGLIDSNMALKHKQEELQRNQKSLVMAEKMAGLGQVAAGVAHEINNPTGFMMNNLCTMHEYHFFLSRLVTDLMRWYNEADQLSDEERAALQQSIQETLKLEDLSYVLDDMRMLVEESIAGAERIKDITQGLKGYAYSGEQEVDTDLNQCVESTLKLVNNEIKYHCTVETDLQDLPMLRCVGGHMNQVIMNLVVNAAHAMQGKNGVLKIATWHDQETVFLSVEDNGCGIPEEKLSRIFEPFFTTKPIGEGTGLGMSISYDIVKKYGGDIQVTSELGLGTRFELRFPLQRAPGKEDIIDGLD